MSRRWQKRRKKRRPEHFYPRRLKGITIDFAASPQSFEPYLLWPVIPAENSSIPLSVKTAEPVPKDLIPEVMEQLKKIHISAPIAMGQIILPNICGTGVDIIATRPLP